MKRRSFMWKAGAALSGAFAAGGGVAATGVSVQPAGNDVDAIRKLHHAFGLSVNSRLHDAVSGRRFVGLLPDPAQHDVVEIAADGRSATARFHCLMQSETALEARASIVEMARQQGEGSLQWWEAGVFENAYVKDGGKWKVQQLAYRATTSRSDSQIAWGAGPGTLIARC